MLWRSHMAHPFLVEHTDDDDWTEADWAGWDAAVAGHVATHLGGTLLDGDRMADLRNLVTDGATNLPRIKHGAGRVQMTRVLLMATLLADGRAGDA